MAIMIIHRRMGGSVKIHFGKTIQSMDWDESADVATNYQRIADFIVSKANEDMMNGIWKLGDPQTIPETLNMDGVAFVVNKIHSGARS